MPQQEYIKHLYEKEELSINEISNKVGVNWRTAAKYAKRSDWNPVQTTRKRRRPVLEPFTDTIDVWLLEDRLLARKDRRTAKAIWELLKKDHDFTGSERTVRAYVAERKKALKYEQQEKYIEIEHPIGEAPVDFGTVRTIWDSEFKEFRSLTTAFPWSNAGLGVPVPSENSLCFLYALRLSFEMAGGVPKKIRFGNLTAAVSSFGKNGERVLNELFVRFMLHYRFEAEFCKPIDWAGHFAIFVRKPKGARNSTLYRFLPSAVKSYLEANPEAFRERINFVHTLLQEGYEMGFIEKALEKAGASRVNDQAIIWHLLYQLSTQEKANSELDDDYSPPSVKNYLPRVEDYDQLVPSGRGGNVNATITI